MKRCPQCNTVFDDSLVYCTNDGTVLKQESFVLPTAATVEPDDEEITVVHRDPITVDIPNAAPPPPTEKFNYQTPPHSMPPPVAETIVVEKRRNTGKYVLFLLLGLLLGGGLVLAAILFSIYLMQGRQNNTANVNAATQSSPANSKSKTATPPETPVAASAKHAARTDASDDEFNGRVISQNAYVRLAPSRGSSEVDVLPTGDRLNIDERENEDSPWFHVTCEHGTSGWMHGNTIEYK